MSVYLDHNATTPLDPKVKDAIKTTLDHFGNPSSAHKPGRDAFEIVESARTQIANLVECNPENVTFTSGGTESNNHVIQSTWLERLSAKQPCHIISSPTEHPSVLAPLKHVEKLGATVSFLPVNHYGQIDPNDLVKLITKDTALISIMAANNETGALQPINDCSDIAATHHIPFHTDAVQAIGKHPLSFRKLNATYLTLSGHKFYGPKGIGATIIKEGHKPCLLYGGPQERELRGGTPNLTGIAGIGKAAEIASQHINSDIQHLSKLKAQLCQELTDAFPNMILNHHPTQSLPNTVHVSFPPHDAQSLLMNLDLDGIAISTGAACSTGSLEPSHVLIASHLAPSTIASAIRISLGRSNTSQDIQRLIHSLKTTISPT